MPGRIERGDDADYFRLELSEKTDLAIFTTGSLATSGRLLDSTNLEVAADDGGGGAFNFMIEGSGRAGSLLREGGVAG